MKTVLLIGGGIQEVPAVQKAKEWGYKVLVTDRNKISPCFQYADGHAVIDGKDIERLVAYAWENKVDGVFTMTELVTTVAVLADILNLPGCNARGAVDCQNKALTHRLLRDTGIPVPLGSPAAGLVEIETRLKILGGEAFIKPVIGSGAKGARKVSSAREIADYHGQVMIQEYLEGTHHDASGLIDRWGHFYPLGITDREFENLKEVRVSAPTWLTDEQQTELYKYLYDGAWTLGIREGPIKCDAMLTDDGFKILEYAPRLHGPKSTLYVLPAVGIEPLLPALQCLTGQSIDTVSLNTDRGARMDYINNEWVLRSGIMGVTLGITQQDTYFFGE